MKISLFQQFQKLHLVWLGARPEAMPLFAAIFNFTLSDDTYNKNVQLNLSSCLQSSRKTNLLERLDLQSQSRWRWKNENESWTVSVCNVMSILIWHQLYLDSLRVSPFNRGPTCFLKAKIEGSGWRYGSIEWEHDKAYVDFNISHSVISDVSLAPSLWDTCSIMYLFDIQCSLNRWTVEPIKSSRRQIKTRWEKKEESSGTLWSQKVQNPSAFIAFPQSSLTSLTSSDTCSEKDTD